jgi:hypothetical protein
VVKIVAASAARTPIGDASKSAIKWVVNGAVEVCCDGVPGK